LEVVNTRRFGQLEKQDIYKKTSNKCFLIEACGKVFDCESQMCASNETEYFITVRSQLSYSAGLHESKFSVTNDGLILVNSVKKNY